MRIGQATVGVKTQLRDEHGRFARRIEEGAHEAAKELADHIAAEAVSIVLSELRERSGQLVGSIESEMIGPYQGHVKATAPHAEPQEFGGSPHDIPNSFGRGPDFGFGHNVGRPFFHPGNPAIHFMKRAGEMTSMVSMGIVAKHMPKG